MACYHPMKAFVIGTTSGGKRQMKIAPFVADHVEKVNDHWNVALTEFVSPYSTAVVNDFVEIPCGKCVGCRLEYSRQWANRCLLELQYHHVSWFLTLTYDDEHLPFSESFDQETGEMQSVPTLVKRDVQLFFKRLRKAYDKNPIKYFLAGEYGPTTGRPHYHCIVYGLDVPDMELYAKSPNGDLYFNSEWLSSIWKNGFVVIGQVTWESCAYTARYIMKKQTGKAADVYDEYNIQPEFTLSSRRPAIGRQYYDDHKQELLASDKIYVSTEKGGRKFSVPRYFLRLAENDIEKGSEESISYPSQENDIASLRFNREVKNEALTAEKLKGTSLDYLEQLLVEEDVKLKRIKTLKRGDL